MCGDTQCGSCGPAQGNWKCAICGAWADDGCEHVDEETGALRPEHQARADAAEREQDQAEDAMCAELDKLGDDYFSEETP